MGNIGPTELIIVLVIVLLIFGPKRLPSLGRQLGSGMREFKDSITGRNGDDEKEETVTALPPAPEQDDASARPAAAPPAATPTGEPGPGDAPDR